eukprot:156649_1
MHPFTLLLFLFPSCHSQRWLDQCKGSVLNANNGAKVAMTSAMFPNSDNKKTWQTCAHCVTANNKAGYPTCAYPNIAVSVTCQCDLNNHQNCRCRDNLSFIGMFIVAVIGPVLAFFGFVLLLFLCKQRTSSRPKGFNQTSIVDARAVGVSPAAQYTPRQRRPPPVPTTLAPPMSMPQQTPTIPRAQASLTRTPHYVSRSRQQRF